MLQLHISQIMMKISFVVVIMKVRVIITDVLIL
jgi:hypothetical protein